MCRALLCLPKNSIKRLYRFLLLSTVHSRTRDNGRPQKFAPVVEMLGWRQCAARVLAAIPSFTSS